MHSLRRSTPPPSKPTGLPIWVLVATAPVVVSLGLLFGVAIAIYSVPNESVTPPSAPDVQINRPAVTAAPVPAPSPMPAPLPVPVPAPPIATVTPSAPSVTFRPSDDRLDFPLDPLSSLEPVRSPGEVTQAPAPEQQPPLVMRDVRDARNELVRSFSAFQAGTVTISNIDYQQMANRAQSTAIVGILSLEGYADWNRALELDSNRLQKWLESAAQAVLPATRNDRVFISWAVVDVRNARPAGFAAHEVTELSNGTYLIIRPLASTMSHLDSVVTMRSRESLGMSARLGPNEGGPWTTYTPVLNFDATDKYRPPSTAGTRPR